MSEYQPTLWVKHNRVKYTGLRGLYIVTIERVGKRWMTELTSIITGEVVNLETRSPLSVAIQQAEARAAQHSTAHLERKE